MLSVLKRLEKTIPAINDWIIKMVIMITNDKNVSLAFI